MGLNKGVFNDPDDRNEDDARIKSLPETDIDVGQWVWLRQSFRRLLNYKVNLFEDYMNDEELYDRLSYRW